MALPDIKVRVTAETGSLDSGLNSATASLNRFSKTSQQVAQQMGGMARSTDAAAGSVSNIAFQFQDIAMMMASGQSPFILAMQQGTQLAGVLNTMKNPIAGLGAAFLQVLNPVSLVTIAAVGLGAAAVQAFTNSSKKIDENTNSLDANMSRIRQIVSGYSEAEKAATKFADIALRMPIAATMSNITAEINLQAKALEDMGPKFSDLTARFDAMSQSAAAFGVDPQTASDIDRISVALKNTQVNANSTIGEFDQIINVLTQIANNTGDKNLRDWSNELLNTAKSARDAAISMRAAQAAMLELQGTSARGFASGLDKMSGLYMDMRSSYEQARDSAAQAYAETMKNTQGEIERTAAAQEYKRVLDSINAAEAAATAKANAPTGGGVDKAAQLAEQVAQLQASLEGEASVETAAYQKKMELLAQYYDGKDALMAERQQYEQLATQQHADKLAQIEAAARAKQMQQQQMMVSNVTSIMGSISQIIGAAGEKQIGIQKGISTAIAAINTAQGISKAFADYGWPGGLLPAAAIAAQGVAQIAAINSASRTGAQVASPAASGGATETAMNRTLTVQGITPGQIFSGDAMRDFMEQMLQMQRDGYQVVLA